jgi:hypothetical protein
MDKFVGEFRSGFDKSDRQLKVTCSLPDLASIIQVAGCQQLIFVINEFYRIFLTRYSAFTSSDRCHKLMYLQKDEHF